MPKMDSITFLEKLTQFVVELRERGERAVDICTQIADGTYGKNMKDFDKGWVAGQAKLLKDLIEALP